MGKENLSDHEAQAIIEELRRRAESPMGVALTQVLLSLNRKNMQLNLRDFSEMLPNICLAGMNFHLSGVDERARNWSCLNLSGVDFRGAYLKKAHFEESQLDGVNLQYADLSVAKLQGANLDEAKLQGANLTLANLQGATLILANLQGAHLFRADLQGAHLILADLQDANLIRAKMQNANLSGCDLFGWEQLKRVNDGGLTGSKITEEDFKDKIYLEWKAETDPEWEALTKVEKMAVMKKFHDETGMYILNEREEQIMP
ncbi:pentapeptide repeat-containing protein [Neisseria elongata]|uniref:pentapeptide repeat-containing protein n=1 Tax=Neisseria elongata TaxID=495 RepID=UPI0021151150|nr:pentapeptide repeat-containing protein [Neisseria elongata]